MLVRFVELGCFRKSGGRACDFRQALRMEAASGRAPDGNERQDDNADTDKVEKLDIANAEASDSDESEDGASLFTEFSCRSVLLWAAAVDV